MFETNKIYCMDCLEGLKQKLILPFQENKSRLCSLCKCKIEEKEFMIRKNKDLFHLDCFKKIKIVKGRDEGRID